METNINFATTKKFDKHNTPPYSMANFAPYQFLKFMQEFMLTTQKCLLYDQVTIIFCNSNIYVLLQILTNVNKNVVEQMLLARGGSSLKSDRIQKLDAEGVGEWRSHEPPRGVWGHAPPENFEN